MRKILVILTGGTIGSCVSGGVIAPDGETAFEVVESFKREYGEEEEFECIVPYTMLSEDMDLSDITRLCTVLSERKDKGYKGIIITHGTDSLSFSAAFLALAFYEKLSCPVVMVSADKPLSYAESNGLYNFAGAVWLIDYLSRSGFYNDVYVTWHSGGTFAAYRGAELREADAGSDDFGVFGGHAFAEFYPEGLNVTGERYVWRTVINDMHDNRCEDVPEPGVREEFAKKGFVIDDAVLAIRMFPGLDFERFDTDEVSAVLVYGYHSGTFPGKEGKGSFKAFLGKMKAQGVRVYLASFKEDAGAVYESVAGLDGGVSRIYDMSFEAAYAYVLITESVQDDK